MKCLVILVLAIVAYVNAGGYGHGGYGHGGYGHGGYGHGGHSDIYHEQKGKAYKFGYEISSPYHGNYHTRHEEGIGGKAVKGSYTLKEKDGSLRIVEYVADHGGVRAVVKDKYGVHYHGHHGGYGGYDGGYGGHGHYY